MLERLYKEEGLVFKDIVKFFPNRSEPSIRSKIYRLGIKREEEEEEMIEPDKLKWNLHKAGERLMVVKNSLSYEGAVEALMDAPGMEISGYRDKKFIITIRRGSD